MKSKKYKLNLSIRLIIKRRELMKNLDVMIHW